MFQSEVAAGMQVTCYTHPGTLRVLQVLTDCPGYCTVEPLDRPGLIFTRPTRQLQRPGYDWEYHVSSRAKRERMRKAST